MNKVSPAVSLPFILIFSLITLLLAGCQPAEKTAAAKVSPQCLKQQSKCVVRTPGGDFQILFNVDRVLTETPFEILIEYQGRA